MEDRFKTAEMQKALGRFAHNVPVNARRALLSKRNKRSIRAQWKKKGGKWVPVAIEVSNHLADTYASGQLADSLEGEVTETGVKFSMLYYGYWVDKGRKRSEKFPPPASLQKWVRDRKLRLRDEAGRYIKGGAKAAAFLIGRKIKTFGILPTWFFTAPLERAIDKLPYDLIDAFSRDLDNEIDYLQNDNN